MPPIWKQGQISKSEVKFPTLCEKLKAWSPPPTLDGNHNDQTEQRKNSHGAKGNLK